MSDEPPSRRSLCCTQRWPRRRSSHGVRSVAPGTRLRSHAMAHLEAEADTQNVGVWRVLALEVWAEYSAEDQAVKDKPPPRRWNSTIAIGPKKLRAKGRGPIPQRRSPVTKKPRKAPKKVNAKRKAREFARAYGSKERVAWVKSLPCVACTSNGRSDNHHICGDGAGRKADHTSIIPLCRACHLAWHRFGRRYVEVRAGFKAEQVAAATEQRWQTFNGQSA
jgi:hypothetical protein